jgi:hypothetical protein
MGREFKRLRELPFKINFQADRHLISREAGLLSEYFKPNKHRVTYMSFVGISI